MTVPDCETCREDNLTDLRNQRDRAYAEVVRLRERLGYPTTKAEIQAAIADLQQNPPGGSPMMRRSDECDALIRWLALEVELREAPDASPEPRVWWAFIADGYEAEPTTLDSPPPYPELLRSILAANTARPEANR